MEAQIGTFCATKDINIQKGLAKDILAEIKVLWEDPDLPEDEWNLTITKAEWLLRKRVRHNLSLILDAQAHIYHRL